MVKMHFCPFLPFLGPFFDFLSGPERSILGVRTRFWWSKMPKSNLSSFGERLCIFTITLVWGERVGLVKVLVWLMRVRTVGEVSMRGKRPHHNPTH